MKNNNWSCLVLIAIIFTCLWMNAPLIAQETSTTTSEKPHQVQQKPVKPENLNEAKKTDNSQKQTINNEPKKPPVEELILDPKETPENSDLLKNEKLEIDPEKIEQVEKARQKEVKTAEINPHITQEAINKLFKHGSSLLDKTFEEALPVEEVVKEPEKEIVKVPVEVGYKNILYLGGTDRAETYKRSLDIATRIEKIIKEAIDEYRDHLDVSIDVEDNKYVIKIDDQYIMDVTEEDAIANEVSLIHLLKVWKYNISKTTNKYLNDKLILTDAEIIRYILLSLFVLILLISLIELIRRKTEIKIAGLTNTILTKLFKYIKQSRLKKGRPIKEETENVISEKITSVSEDFKLIYNAVIYLIIVNVIFIYIIIALYYHPATDEIVNSSANNFFAAIFAVADSVYYWFVSEQTWKGIVKAIIAILDMIIVIFFLKIITAIVINVSDIILADRVQRAKHIETIIKVVHQTLIVLIVIGSAIFILAQLGLDIAPVLAGVGIAGIAVGIAAQNLIKDIINGVFFLIEDQFGMDDIIKIDDTIGRVEFMTLRFTMIRDLSGTAHIVPNSQITRVSIYTKYWARANLDVSIAYKEDVDTAISLINETASKMREEMPELIFEEHSILGVNSLGDSSVDIKIIMKTAPGEQWAVEREFRRRIKYVFDQNNIEIPFPHRTVYMPQNIGYSATKVDNAQAPDNENPQE